MTDHDSILTILKQQEKVLTSQTEQLYNIEKALVNIPVQGKEIFHINNQVDALWRKYDAAFGPEGTISKLQACAASCPKEAVEKNMSRQWAVILFMLALIGALKLWG